MAEPRLYLDAPLDRDAVVPLVADDAHYLRTVLRLKPGDRVRPFNARDGEWSASIERLARHAAEIRLIERRRAPASPAGPRLLMAAIKRPRLEWLLEKATEAGVGRIDLITTSRTVAGLDRADRLGAKLKEAAEQCGRLDVPELTGPTPLVEALDDALGSGPVLMADETRDGLALLSALERHPDAALLVGPEGGFALEERRGLHGRPGVVPVRLGPTILRAETAALLLLGAAMLTKDAAGDRAGTTR